MENIFSSATDYCLGCFDYPGHFCWSKWENSNTDQSLSPDQSFPTYRGSPAEKDSMTMRCVKSTHLYVWRRKLNKSKSLTSVTNTPKSSNLDLKPHVSCVTLLRSYLCYNCKEYVCIIMHVIHALHLIQKKRSKLGHSFLKFVP